MSEPFRWVVVVAPRGDVVRLDHSFSEYENASSLLMSVCTGTLDGLPVTVNGSHISLAWREVPTAWVART